MEWLGPVPAHWYAGKFRHFFRESGEKIEREVIGPMLSVSGYRGIEVKEYDDENRRRLDEDLIGYRIVRVGQLVVNTMWLNYAGLGVSEHEGHVSPAYRSYWISDGLDRRFVHHLLRSGIYVKGYTRLLTGIRPNSLQMSRDDLMEFPILVPPAQDQKLIATFLDRETAKIDALVAEQQRLIELLKEKRQAVISHAVTKGLNPNAPTKPSGIEWLGDVPAHWKIGKCGFYLRIISGFAFPSAGFSHDECDTKLLRGINVGVSRLKWDETVYWRRLEGDELDIYEMNSGDLVIGMDRPLINEGIRVAKVKQSDLPCLLLQRVASLKTNDLLNADFFLALLASEMFVAHFSPDTTGVSVPHISPEQINNFVIPVPPIAEQNAIVVDIEAETTKLDALTAEAQRGIDLLQERRTALISAAVTGQIDVRGLVQAEAA